MFKVNNALIMAAGSSSRFAPLSYERPKALIEARGEKLIERQIRQLQEKGINDIVIVVGYKKEEFEYLKEKYGVTLIDNPSFASKNNNASIYYAQKHIRNTLICSSDNYFAENPFESEYECSFYSGVYSEAPTPEWCMKEDDNGYITEVTIGGSSSWFMLGHVFWDENFSARFLKILNDEFEWPATSNKLWEQIYIEHLPELKMKIRKYPQDFIFEFDTLDELRVFDPTYINDSRSTILKNISRQLNCKEKDITDLSPIKKNNVACGFAFNAKGQRYRYLYEQGELKRE